MKFFIIVMPCLMLCLAVLSARAAHAAGADASRPVGRAEVFLLTEGPGEGNRGLLVGADEELIGRHAPSGAFPMAVNAFLVRTPEARLLVDTGYGRNVFDTLRKLNVSPDQIDAVLLTHMHGDHIGGLLREGRPAFPGAVIYVAERERAYWTDAAVAATRPEARDALQAYGDRVRVFNPGEPGAAMPELLPGIRAIAAYGHTPGHTMFLLGSGQDQLLFWGDLTHAMAVQMPAPRVAMTFDVDPKAAVEIRLKVLRHVAESGLPVAGAHIPIPGMGDVAARGEGYAFTPLP